MRCVSPQESLAARDWGEMHRRGVHNVNNASPGARALTFRTYTVHNVNRALVRAARLTKCTGNRARLLQCRS
jgi:hypothetical protein